MTTRLDDFVDELGLPSLKLLVGAPPPAPPAPETIDVRQTVRKITDDEQLADALRTGEAFLLQEDERDARIEGKAASLLAATGLSATIMLSALGLLKDTLRPHDGWPVRVALFSFVAVALLSFGVALVLALRVIETGRFKRMEPDPCDVLKSAGQHARDRKCELIWDRFHSAERNRDMINGKATYLIGAQIWFRNAAIAAVLAALIAAGMTLLRHRPEDGAPAHLPDRAVSTDAGELRAGKRPSVAGQTNAPADSLVPRGLRSPN
jgi:hypothetical protein